MKVARAKLAARGGGAGTSDSPIIKRIEGKETEKNEKGENKKASEKEKNPKYSIYETSTYIIEYISNDRSCREYMLSEGGGN